MRVRRLSLLPMLAALLIFLSPTPSWASPPGWVTELMQQLAQIPRRETTFVEERKLAALDKPLVSHGRLIYVRPAFLQKITDGPRPGWLTVDGDTISISDAGQPPRRMSLDAQPQIAALVNSIRGALSGNLQDLKRSWHLDAEGALQHWRLALKPADAGLARFVRSLTIAGAGTDIQEIRVVAANGDEQLIRIGAVP